MKCINNYGDETHAAALEEAAAAPAMGEAQRKQLTELAATLRQRAATTQPATTP